MLFLNDEFLFLKKKKTYIWEFNRHTSESLPFLLENESNQ